MTKKASNDTHFTTQVKNLLARAYGRSPLKDSVVERAVEYFDNQPTIDEKLGELKSSVEKSAAQISTDKTNQQLTKAERDLREYEEELRFERNERNQHLLILSRDIISLCEGDSFDENNRKSAQLLGTIQLISPTEGNKVALINEQHKPLYKSVLCLRLLDRLCLDINIDEPYIKEAMGNMCDKKYMYFAKLAPAAYQLFVEKVKIPLVMAALLQDIGNNHPESLAILNGNDNELDPQRTLHIEDRKTLLQINFRETIKYVAEGIGTAIYIGNSKVERDKHDDLEHKKLLFIKHLLKSAINPKKGIGNLVKVPQIYSSIILSTKSSYNYKLLPNVFQALNQNVERGTCSKTVVESLAEITGYFPQGYGVIYIPSEFGVADRFEYAIVSKLYPKVPEQAICRTATRNLAFLSHGQEVVIKKESNLHFTDTARTFTTMSKERLNEILELLASNHEERKALDVLPRCWQPGGYFLSKANQKLWDKGNQPI